MNNWQNWAVALILLLCIVRIGQSIYSFFRGVKEKRNPCANCATGCELKNLYEKKRSECSEERKETNNQTKTEEKIYGVGETTTYKKDGQERVHFTVNSVSNTSDRNEFADSQPEQVIIIHYSYENIANEDDIYFSSINFKVIDEGGNVCETYPASIDTYPQTAPIGTKSEGEEAYGLKQQSSKIKLIVELDYSGTKATYELPIQ